MRGGMEEGSQGSTTIGDRESVLDGEECAYKEKEARLMGHRGEGTSRVHKAG